MSIVAIADELEVHPNTVRFHLDTLIGDGRVEQVAPDRKGPGRPPQMFQATRQMDRGGLRHYRLLAEILATSFTSEQDPRAKALAAGRAWGRRLDPPTGLAGQADTPGTAEAVESLLELLEELGFDPERRGESQVGLRHCPFLELAETRTAVVCPVHLGVMQGALETWKSPLRVDRLEAFAEPDLCLVHLVRST